MYKEKIISIRIEDVLHEMIKREARKNRMSTSQFMGYCTMKYIDSTSRIERAVQKASIESVAIARETLRGIDTVAAEKMKQMAAEFYQKCSEKKGRILIGCSLN